METFFQPSFLKFVRVFVVESDPVYKHILKQLLEYTGIKNHIPMNDSDMAITVSRLVKPDIIISDWKHPRYAYTDILKLYQNTESLRGIPLIIVSADNLDSSREYALQEGAADYLVKPIYLKEFKQAVLRQILSDRQAG